MKVSSKIYLSGLLTAALSSTSYGNNLTNSGGSSGGSAYWADSGSQEYTIDVGVAACDDSQMPSASDTAYYNQIVTKTSHPSPSLSSDTSVSGSYILAGSYSGSSFASGVITCYDGGAGATSISYELLDSLDSALSLTGGIILLSGGSGTVGATSYQISSSGSSGTYTELRPPYLSVSIDDLATLDSGAKVKYTLSSTSSF